MITAGPMTMGSTFSIVTFEIERRRSVSTLKLPSCGVGAMTIAANRCRAAAKGWTVVAIKQDWKTVFAFGNERRKQ